MSFGVRYPSVRSQSRRYISKTKQDRPTVTAVHQQEVGTAASVTAFRFSRDDPRYLFWFHIQYVQIIISPLILASASPAGCYQQGATVGTC